MKMQLVMKENDCSSKVREVIFLIFGRKYFRLADHTLFCTGYYSLCSESSFRLATTSLASEFGA